MKAVASILFLTLAPVAAPMAPPPTTRVENCTTSGCHADQTSFKFLHAPVAAGACEVCHAYADESKHTFTLKHQGAEMCNFCHIGKSEAAGMHVHQPVREGQCTSCHSPHGSENRNMIRGASTGGLCLTCHASVTKDLEHVHTPIAQGDCLGCHKAHSSELPKLLVEQGRALCLRCHANVEQGQPNDAPIGHGVPAVLTKESLPSASNASIDPIATQPAGSSAMVVHEPFKGDCTQCHDQHASHQPALLKQPATELCTSCHKDIAQKIAAASVPHSAVVNDRACLNCHAPHSGHDASLMRGEAVAVCLDCHNQPIKKADGATIESVATMIANGQHLHGPLDSGQCAACHDVHGGTHRALLTHPYTQSFYQSFESDAYALCFSCHKQELATAKTTADATNFRNGDVNLHYAHVVAPGDSGRSCRVCHATHSATNQQQLRDSVPYGQWQVPIAFSATANGGSCGAGCHRARSYDRVTPVVNDPAR